MGYAMLPLLALLAVPLLAAHGETVITGQDASSRLVIGLDGADASYTMTFAGSEFGREPLEGADPKLALRSYGFIIIDRANDFAAIVRDSGDKYVMSVKAGGMSRTYDTVYSRDAGAGALYETDAEEAKRLLEADLAKLRAQNDRAGSSDQINIGMSYEEYKKLDAKDDAGTVVQVDVEEDKGGISLFLEAPIQVVWRHELRYHALVTDTEKVLHRSEFGSFVGNPISGVSLESTVRDTEGAVVYRSNGTSSRDGSWGDQGYVAVDNSVSNKPYTVEVAATWSDGGKEYTAKRTADFYSVPFIDASNRMPNASAYLDPKPIQFTSQGDLVAMAVETSLGVNLIFEDDLNPKEEFMVAVGGLEGMVKVNGTIKIAELTGVDIVDGMNMSRTDIDIDSDEEIKISTLMGLLAIKGDNIVGERLDFMAHLDSMDIVLAKNATNAYNYTESIDYLFKDFDRDWKFAEQIVDVTLDASSSSDSNDDKINRYEWILANTELDHDNPPINSAKITCDKNGSLEVNDAVASSAPVGDVMLEGITCAMNTQGRTPPASTYSTDDEFAMLTFQIPNNPKYANEMLCFTLVVQDHHLAKSRPSESSCTDIEFSNKSGYYR